jgi:Kef-type K+ transport system membrane component KefB
MTVASLADISVAAAETSDFLIVLFVILVAAKLLGELAERTGQPAVLGELIAGVLLGVSLLGLVDPSDEVLHLLAELGVILLLFQIGLETRLEKLAAVGSISIVVAVTGVVLPFVLGYFVAVAVGLEAVPALVIGAALTATSVGITARVLADLGRLNGREGQVILGAAIIDDIIGLVILAVVSSIIAGDEITLGGVARLSLVAFGFLAIALALGPFFLGRLFDLIGRHTRADRLGVMGLAAALGLALLAQRLGSASIIGAFAAGVILGRTTHHKSIEQGCVRLGHFVVPIFFVAVGAAVDVRALLQRDAAVLAALLVAAGIVGKIVAGYAAFWFKGNKTLIGVGMIPRGEVGLIFAQTGLAAGALDSARFSAVAAMVLITTLIAPPWLKLISTKQEAGDADVDAGGLAVMASEA